MINTKMLFILLASPMLLQSCQEEEYPEDAKTLYTSTEFRLSQIENHLWRLEGRLTRLRSSNQIMRNELAAVQKFQGSIIRDYSSKTDELNRKIDELNRKMGELSGYVTSLQSVLTKLLGIHVIQATRTSDKKPVSTIINQIKRDIDELKQARINDRRDAASLAKEIADLEASIRRKLGKTPNPFAIQEAEEMLRLNGLLSPKR